MKNFLAILLGAALLVSCTPAQKQPLPTPEPEPEPVPEEIPVSKGAYKHIVLLGVDGAGAFFSEATSPNCMNIFKDGAQSFKVQTSRPSISAQCWGSMLHGVLPQFHRLTNDNTGVKKYDPESPFPSIFRITREAMPDVKLASFCNWRNINYGIIEDGFGVTKGNVGNDQTVTEMALSYLEDSAPAILFVAWDSVDAAGHSNGFGSAEHKEALRNVDKMIKKIYDALKDKGLLDDTLLMVSADHGGTPDGSHGGDSDAEMNVYLGALGKTVEKGGTITDAEVQDIAAIAAYALGVEIPETWTGRVPSGLFKGVTATERKTPEIPVSENRKHETVPTPDITKTKELLKDHKVIAYLPFDGNEKVAFGSTEATKHGKQYYYNAYFGDGLVIEDGYITLEDVKLGTESFSVAFWLKADYISGDPSIISNKNWENGGNDGFVLSLRPDDIKFNAGCKEKGERMDCTASLPIDYNQGWMHVILVVDRKDNKVKFYYDFKLEDEGAIPSALKNVTFDALSLNIGQDGTGKYTDKMPAQLDDMIITADVLTESDIAAMKEYYK